jgi:hypothetical protein
VARSGRHAYDLRRLAKWKGNIDQANLSWPDVRAELREPTFGDECDLFLAPEMMIPASVHVLSGHSLFGYPWELTLLAIFAGISIFLKWKAAKSWPSSLLLGFVAAWAVMDARVWLDHVLVVKRAQAKGTVPFPLNEIDAFCQRAAALIGNHSWTRECYLAGSQFFDDFVDYQLAEHPFRLRDDPEAADYLIAAEVESRNEVLRTGPYRLLQKDEPRASDSEPPRPQVEKRGSGLWTILTIIAYLAASFWTGWAVLCLLPGTRTVRESLVAAFLVGIYAETLGVATLLFMGLPLLLAAWLVPALPVILTLLARLLPFLLT